MCCLLSFNFRLEGATEIFLNKEERENLEFFLRGLTIDLGGEGIIFIEGKPLSLISIPYMPYPCGFFKTENPFFAMRTKFLKGYKVWLSIQKHSKEARIVAFKLPDDSCIEGVIVANLAEITKVLDANQEIFFGRLGRKITAEDVVEMIYSSKDLLLRDTLGHEDLLGILLGFGTKNSIAFVQKPPLKLFEKLDQAKKKSFLYFTAGGVAAFPLPTYMFFDEKETNERFSHFYQKAAEMQQIYYHEDLVDFILKKAFPDIYFTEG